MIDLLIESPLFSNVAGVACVALLAGHVARFVVYFTAGFIAALVQGRSS